MNDNNSANDDSMIHVPDDFTINDFLISPKVIPNVLPDNLICSIDTVEELQKYIDTSNNTFFFF